MKCFCYSVKKRIKKKEEEEEKSCKRGGEEKSRFRLGRPFCGKSIHIFLRSTLKDLREAESARLLSDTQKISAEKEKKEILSNQRAQLHDFFVDYESIKKTSHHHHFGYIISNFFCGESRENIIYTTEEYAASQQARHQEFVHRRTAHPRFDRE